MKQLSKEGFTNHSIKETCTMQLFDSGVPEASVQKQTSHKSLESLRTYERVTLNQKAAISELNFISQVVDPDSAFSPSEM